MKNIYASIFGESPETRKARGDRDTAFQAMLDSRKQSVEKQRTDDVKMARYNALGNVLTSMVQPLGWAAGGSSAGVQPYDNRQYIEAFNRAVKASDNLRNIGTAEDAYRFKLADEDYRRKLALDDAARERAFREEDLERKYQQKMEEQQRKFENDMAKINRQGEIKMQIAEFNAAHKIVNRSTGQSADWRMKSKLLDGYNRYATQEASYGREPISYPEWLERSGFSINEESSGNTGNGGRGRGSSTTTEPANTQTQTQTQTAGQTQTPQQGWGVMSNSGFMYNPSPAVSSGTPASAGGAPVVFHLK